MIHPDVDIRSILSNLLFRVDIHVYTPEEVEEYGSEEYLFVYSILKTGEIIYEVKKINLLNF